MELKSYQRAVIKDLTRYLELLNETRNSAAAYTRLWQEKSMPVGLGGLPRYQEVIPGVPTLCFKVPTGGGKTYLACNSIRPIFDALPATKARAVVWLVPSDAILTQTVKCLKDPNHPYRQKINVDFGGRVTVYTKQELLNGQNFNLTAITEQLSVMVLSYDSFRGRGKEGLKAYQENSALAAISQGLGKPQQPIENADETALFQVINQLSPLVIVDESHHARSELSLEMLKNFNPCFVLDLTATPKKQSNIISYVDAVQLKRENMVKLPVIVYNRDNQGEVLADAVDLRRRLEELAVQEEAKGGRYIRPIVLFQAQPRGKEDSTTFEKLRDRLVEAGIPAGEIAIRTADVNELKNIDLLSQNCPIRYIITVNALKEGWDCPFAYILASLANKTSKVDVEQILGRILRLPNTRKNNATALNISYVLTSSNDFDTTVKGIVNGLYNAGFSDRDYREAAPATVPPTPQPEFEQTAIQPQNPPQEEKPDEEYLDFDPAAVGRAIEARESDTQEGENLADMLAVAERTGQEYEQTVEQSGDPVTDDLPWEVRDMVKRYPVKPEFLTDVESICIPQFFHVIPQTLFTDGNFELLSKEQLAEGFTLKGKPYAIDFGTADDEIAEVDVREQEGGLPKVFKMSDESQQYFKEYFNSLPPESRVRQCKDMMFHQLNKMDQVDAGELRAYVDRIVGDMDRDQLAAMEKSPLGFANKIKAQIEVLLTQHYREVFDRWLDTEKIVCRPSYRLPLEIHPARDTTPIGGSLYQAEEDVNNLERRLIMALTALPNVKWWHRNVERRGFCINGFINHYPDIMLMTQSGKIIMVETKGEHLKNDDSREKIALGKAWQNAAGSQYRYYMVFEDGVEPLSGAANMNRFLKAIEAL